MAEFIALPAGCTSTGVDPALSTGGGNHFTLQLYLENSMKSEYWICREGVTPGSANTLNRLEHSGSVSILKTRLLRATMCASNGL